MRVYKYGVVLNNYFELELPKDAKILTVQMQHEKPYIWALVNPAEESEKRFFRVAKTGHPIDESNLQYIGSFQMNGGMLVFHLFEIK